ncbi:MAG: hypothetical protein DMF60_09550 [Acidobacteria bacterium]|nr:MAG: hypothetical protein DMF60_09550 [Acidobacteriota bacterium]
MLAILLSIANVSLADTSNAERSGSTAARKALSENSSESAAAIAALRARGQLGLEDFLDAFAAELKNRELEISANATRPPGPEWRRLSAALDQVCKQHDCYASRLFWYTDINEAKAAAKLSGKPILSLRLLGKLDEELSCANSRFFRLILYSNTEVSNLLRKRFILHWQSVRPVPKVTIDFGDGRKLERTLTGNSIHYILDSDGRPRDALPGLYGPQAFVRELERAERVAAACSSAKNDADRELALRQYHSSRFNELSVAWAADIATARISSPPSREPIRPDVQVAASPRAEVASRAAITKALPERPVLRGISSNPRALDPTVEDAAWERISELHADDALLDANSKLLIRAKNPGQYGGSDATARASLDRAMTNFERAVAVDTVRNEYVKHSKIHEWFAREAAPTDVTALNDRVYRELFLTPSSDPWLGLFPRDSYTGIENDGVSK